MTSWSLWFQIPSPHSSIPPKSLAVPPASSLKGDAVSLEGLVEECCTLSFWGAGWKGRSHAPPSTTRPQASLQVTNAHGLSPGGLVSHLVRNRSWLWFYWAKLSKNKQTNKCEMDGVIKHVMVRKPQCCIRFFYDNVKLAWTMSRKTERHGTAYLFCSRPQVESLNFIYMCQLLTGRLWHETPNQTNRCLLDLPQANTTLQPFEFTHQTTEILPFFH